MGADAVAQFGLVAEEVEKLNADLVVHDEDGRVSGVRYEAVNAMLLNEFLKEHREVRDQKATIAELKSAVAQLSATVKAQGAKVEKVSATVEANKPAPLIARRP